MFDQFPMAVGQIFKKKKFFYVRVPWRWTKSVLRSLFLFTSLSFLSLPFSFSVHLSLPSSAICRLQLVIASPNGYNNYAAIVVNLRNVISMLPVSPSFIINQADRARLCLSTEKWIMQVVVTFWRINEGSWGTQLPPLHPPRKKRNWCQCGVWGHRSRQPLPLLWKS